MECHHLLRLGKCKSKLLCNITSHPLGWQLSERKKNNKLWQECGEIGKANTKDVGVQVSLRVGKSVQCSLGPRTLDSLSPWASAGHRAPASAWGVSSSVPGHWGEVRLREELSDPPEAGQPPPPLPPPSPPPRSEEDPPEELQPREELVEEDSSSPRERKSKPAPVDSSQPLGRPNFQFLEPKYGYFHCKDCKTRWESAYVWCISGTNKVSESEWEVGEWGGHGC